MKRVRHRGDVSVFRMSLLIVLLLPYLAPFGYVLFTSLKSNATYSVDPLGLSGFRGLVSYREAWSATDLGAELLHSLLAAGVGVIVSVTVSVLGGYWLFAARSRRARQLVSAVLLSAMAVPSTVYVIPLFVQLASAGLVDNLVVLGTIYGAIGAPLGSFLMRSYLMQLPTSVFDAASVDGAGTTSLLRLVVLPLCLPVIGTIATLIGILGLSDLLLASVMITGQSQTTAVVGIATLANMYDSQVPEVAAGVVVALIPILTVFLIAQRALRRGITSGMER